VSPEASHPFASIESAHEFVALLQTTMDEAIADLQELLATANTEQDERRTQALNLALYKINQLSVHMQKSRRILNDLRSLRILLFQERTPG
jgi:hypothetical protein